MAEALSEQTLINYLQDNPGRSVTVRDLTFAFGGIAQQHTAMLKTMVVKGYLDKKGRGYVLSQDMRPARAVERDKRAKDVLMTSSTRDAALTSWDRFDQCTAIRKQGRALVTNWDRFDQRIAGQVVAKEWPSEDAMKKHLKDHPGADPSSHSFSKPSEGKGEDEGKGEKGKGDKGESKPDVKINGKPGFPVPMPKLVEPDRDATDDEIEDFRGSVPKSKLFKDYNLDIVAGTDGKTTVNDLLRAKHVAEAVMAHIEEDASKPEGDLCQVRPNLCKGNKGIFRSSMPQLMEEPIGQMGKTDEERIDDFNEKARKKAKKKGESDPDFWDSLDEKKKKKKLKKWKATRDKYDGYVAAAEAQGKSKKEIAELVKSDKSPKDQFIDSLIEEFGETDDEVPVQDLKATQKDIKANKSYSMAESYLLGNKSPWAPRDKSGKKVPWSPAEDEILISKDGFILDGHHRWSSAVISDPDIVMKVKRIGLNMDELLEKSFQHPGTFRADINDKIQDPNSPLDLARKNNSTWQQANGKTYAKNGQGQAGGPFESEEAAKSWMQSGPSGEKPKKPKDEGKKDEAEKKSASSSWDAFDAKMAANAHS